MQNQEANAREVHVKGATLQPRWTNKHALRLENLPTRTARGTASGSYKYFDHARELPRVKKLFDELKPFKEAAEWKDEEPRLRAEMRNVNTDYYGFNRDEDAKTKEVEKAGEKRAYQGWTPIPGG